MSYIRGLYADELFEIIRVTAGCGKMDEVFVKPGQWRTALRNN
jgi:hypothetical protein